MVNDPNHKSNYIKKVLNSMSDSTRTLPPTSEQVLAMALAEIQDRIWSTADKAGWHDKPRSVAEGIALMHSELSEALEEVRNGEPNDLIYYTTKMDGKETRTQEKFTRFVFADEDRPDEIVPNKVEGIAAELADAIIRILDDCRTHKIPVIQALFEKMEFNETRPYRHGGKAL